MRKAHILQQTIVQCADYISKTKKEQKVQYYISSIVCKMK